MARALLVGCGCRGRELGSRLISDGWLVRGTTREPDKLEALDSAGIDAQLADPDRIDTILDHVADVAVVYWLLASARGGAEAVSALHEQRLQRVLEELVDTPVRGFVYEAAGSAGQRRLKRGAAIVRGAAERWRIPIELVNADPAQPSAWAAAMAEAARRLSS